jgi:hypothetical protein
LIASVFLSVASSVISSILGEDKKKSQA